MTDLVCLVADKNIQAAIEGILRRPAALGLRQIAFETIVHPERDPGCFHRGHELLGGYRKSATHGLMVLDRDWAGAPKGTGATLEGQVERGASWQDLRDWARVVVIDPELEAWVFSDSPHVAAVLGWQGSMSELRSAMSAFWTDGALKPADPKSAVQWALRRAQQPRSSSLYRQLAGKVSLERCQDRAFLRLRDILRGWFHSDQANIVGG